MRSLESKTYRRRRWNRFAMKYSLYSDVDMQCSLKMNGTVDNTKWTSSNVRYNNMFLSPDQYLLKNKKSIDDYGTFTGSNVALNTNTGKLYYRSNLVDKWKLLYDFREEITITNPG